MKKEVLVDSRAARELKKFPRPIQLKFKALFELLGEAGKLEEPFAKKLKGSTDLFEIRVKYEGQWRAIYAYLHQDVAIILSAFAKKTQKTPLTELEKAHKRRRDYE